MLERFFNPKSIAVVGVSEDPKKLGALIFHNVKNANFKGNLYPINSRIGGKILYGYQSYKSVKEIKEPLDLAVFVIAAKFCSATVDDCISNGTKNISIIAAGFSEVGNTKLEKEIAEKCAKNNINLLGPNCLGHISTFTDLNASFTDGYPKKGNVAFISQSGAYCCAMLDWAEKKKIGFSHFISIGNKAMLAEDKLLSCLKDDNNTKIFAFYLESLKNGKDFLKTLSEVSSKKPCLIMEPGRSNKAQMASLSHTGSLTPNYKILQIAFKNAGAIQARNTRELFSLIEVLEYSHHYQFEGSLCIITNGGGAGVVSTDLCEENNILLEKPSDKIIELLKKELPPMCSLTNPIDVLGDAKADRYEKTLKIILESGEYKNLFIILTPQLGTQAKETAEVIVKLYKEYPNINIFTTFIGGNKVQPGIDVLKKNNIINFDYPVDGINLLGLLFNKGKQSDNKMEIEIENKSINVDIKNKIIKAKEEGLPSLPQDIVNEIMDFYHITYPKSANFTDKNLALDFCKKIFPSPVVMKISSPDAIHKTEMKGIFVGINDEKQFESAFESLNEIITNKNLKNASVLIQEMVNRSAKEAIIGMNTDSNFGKIIIFGTGGVYTEVYDDISLRILPNHDFKEMVNETKLGKILNGYRGEKPKNVQSVIDVLEAIQKIAFDFPEIISIDINPLMVTEDKAYVVDFKILLK
jgi:acetyltransferase